MMPSKASCGLMNSRDWHDRHQPALGHLPLDPIAAYLFFQLISLRQPLPMSIQLAGAKKSCRVRNGRGPNSAPAC
jgi:hypothetical protein